MAEFIDVRRLVTTIAGCAVAASLFWESNTLSELSSSFWLVRFLAMFAVAMGGLYLFLFMYESKGTFKAKLMQSEVSYWVIAMPLLAIAVFGVVGLSLLVFNVAAKAHS